jgi:hypothetical protein
MTQRHHLNHATRDCNYHVVFIPKYRKKAVAEVIGFIKGKSSIWIAQNIERKAKNFTGTSSGRVDISSRRWAGTRRQSEPTSGTRSFRIAKWINLR